MFCNNIQEFQNSYDYWWASLESAKLKSTKADYFLEAEYKGVEVAFSTPIFQFNYRGRGDNGEEDSEHKFFALNIIIGYKKDLSFTANKYTYIYIYIYIYNTLCYNYAKKNKVITGFSFHKLNNLLL